MSCNYCTPTKKILNCTTTLIVGTIANLSTAVYVFLESAATGKKSRYAVTSNGAGVVSFTLAQGFNTNQDYTVWVTLQTATNEEERLTINVDGTEHECLIVVFDRVYTSTNTGATATSQTLSL